MFFEGGIHLAHRLKITGNKFSGNAKSQTAAPSVPKIGRVHPKFGVNWSLKNKLLESDSIFNAQIPFLIRDFVKIEDASKMAILTDGQRFYDSPSARAAMAYHPTLFESKGWKWEWRWSRLWKSEV